MTCRGLSQERHSLLQLSRKHGTVLTVFMPFKLPDFPASCKANSRCWLLQGHSISCYILQCCKQSCIIKLISTHHRDVSSHERKHLKTSCSKYDTLYFPIEIHDIDIYYEFCVSQLQKGLKNTADFIKLLSFFFLFFYFNRKWIWQPPQLTRSAGLTWQLEQEYASKISTSNEFGNEQP